MQSPFINLKEGTFDEIIYEYDQIDSGQLLYVVLSHMISINSLYIITANNVAKFYYEWKSVESIVNLQE